MIIMKMIVFFYASILIGCGNSQVLETGLEGKLMPNFTLLTIDSGKINTLEDIPQGKASVFFYLDPKCPFCRVMTVDIIRNFASSKNVNFFFLSKATLKDLKLYYDHFQLGKIKNVTLGQDLTMSFAHYFNPKVVPYLVFYDKEKVLKYVIRGKIGSETLEKYLH